MRDDRHYGKSDEAIEQYREVFKDENRLAEFLTLHGGQIISVPKRHLNTSRNMPIGPWSVYNICDIETANAFVKHFGECKLMVPIANQFLISHFLTRGMMPREVVQKLRVSHSYVKRVRSRLRHKRPSVHRTLLEKRA